MVDYWERNVGRIFTKQRDLNIANAVIELFRNCNRIDAFNKKALYIFVRERTGLITNNITRVVKVLKDIYEINFKKYERNNFINLPF